jgi:hypothetical protein
MMDASNLGDELNRSVKLAVDSGEAASLEEAERIFEGYRLRIGVGSDAASSPTLQAALLTAVNVGRRCFLGGVEVAGCTDAKLLVPWRRCGTILEAVQDLQGKPCRESGRESPLIVIGDFKCSCESEFAVRATFDGWCGGVVPLQDEHPLPERHEFTPSGVFAGALAVSEAFQFIRGRNVHAGRRSIGLSLWRPEAEINWLGEHDRGPVVEWLPSQLWLIGLGHLGQAYLWTLGFLPYADSGELSLVLQDFDSLVLANDSTSPLTNRRLLGQRKTRAMADWCEERGFRTRIVERRFNSNFTIDDEEPRVALCSVDNELARAALEEVGFAQVVEAGLGLGTEEYLAFQMHCFPAGKAARDRWSGSSLPRQVDSITNQVAYQHLAANGFDQCGLTSLAGRSVGASFVGTATSALVVAELLRMCMGDQRYEVIDGSLRSLCNRQAIASKILTRPFNPGLAQAVTS